MKDRDEARPFARMPSGRRSQKTPPARRPRLMNAYICKNPDHPNRVSRRSDRLPPDGFCPDCEFGSALLEKADPQDLARLEEGSFVSGVTGEIGLCILVCDVSYSMQSPAFPGNPAHRIDLLSAAAAKGIADLYSISHPGDAIIAVTVFGDRAKMLTNGSGKPFLRSIEEIRQDYPEAPALRDFFRDGFLRAGDEIGNKTDITAALHLARSIHSDAISGSLARHGGPERFTVKEHDIHVRQSGTVEAIPNIRTVIYSDGDHNSGSPLQNPYQKDAFSTLLTLYFGAADESGAKTLSALSGVCPEHGHPGFFLVDTPSGFATLRHLFRMACGASGFCEQCLAIETAAFHETAGIGASA